MVGDAGVERHGRDGVDDGGVVRLLLVALAVRVDEQRDQAAQDGAAEAHGDHVEEVEVCGGDQGRALEKGHSGRRKSDYAGFVFRLRKGNPGSIWIGLIIGLCLAV